MLVATVLIAAIAVGMPLGGNPAEGEMTIEQTLSDQAQQMTIAFDGEAFLTGSLGADSFLPPGKVADFWGFQYLRDNDPTEMGHNTDFLTRAANNVLFILAEAQITQLVTLAEGQVDDINQYAYDRFVLMVAFRRLLEGDLPDGTTGLDLDAVKTYSAQLYTLDGQISIERAEVMGGILHALDASQIAYLDAMVGQGMLDWPDVPDQLDPRDYSRDAHVAVMTYAADLFSWYAGSVEADVYFCPERQGTYFGSFYLKDAPAMGNPDYTIDPNLTADVGAAFLAELTAEQAQTITDLVDAQRAALYEIVDRRTDVATELRQAMTGGTIDTESVLALMERYGELDGEIVYRYATAFAEVGKSLSAEQETALAAIRADCGVTQPDGAYLYSDPIDMPTIADSDFLFAAAPAPGNAAYPIVDTGQVETYDNVSTIVAPLAGQPFYGQDAQHDGNQPSYTVSGDGLTVYDNVTGLTWTQTADWTDDGTVDSDDKFTYAEAVAYVATLNAQTYGGHSDWRLPTIKDLYSLIDYRGTDPNPEASSSAGLIPFIDDSVFEFAYGDTSAGERIIDSQWATSTLYVSTVMGGQQAMFGVNFADGRIKGYPTVNKTYYARFCRGNTDYGTNSFADNGDGTVTDSAAGLMWSQSDNGSGLNWKDALAWVAARNSANYLGYDDWRLPNAKELQSLVDYTRSPDTHGAAAIDPLFNVTQITNEAGDPDFPFYWSSTTFLRFNGSGAAAVYVAFGRGLGSMDGVNVIDVHGAGCQRSDPKDGDPGDYPTWGNGPQGDVQRVFNYVRLVRDTAAGSTPDDTAAVFRVAADGDTHADGSVHGAQFQTGAADVAEWVQVSEPLEPGMVVELDPTSALTYRPSRTACSSLVAGVISTEPGVEMGRADLSSQTALLALVGIVPVWVTDEGGPIQPGDLLVSSSTPGHAMRWDGSGSCSCTLVGKALEAMADTHGIILVLLMAH